jgi:3-dehydrotetronate 4-kinase
MTVPGGPRLGCVADDYTGGTDVASALRREGLGTVLLFGRPRPGWTAADADAVVVALKSRNLPPADAVAVSLAARRWLGEQGIGQLYFKYCSTFDSTDDGNIGPVADALLEAAGVPLTVVCPTAPEHGRTVHQGHLFVGDRLLSESSMRHHPLTPMTDADLVRVLGRQTPHRVGLVPAQVVRQGSGAVAAALDRLRGQGARYAVTDAATDDDLAAIAAACRELPVVTGAAGLVRLLAAESARENPTGRCGAPRTPRNPPARCEVPRTPGNPPSGCEVPRRGSVAHRGKGGEPLSTAPAAGGGTTEAGGGTTAEGGRLPGGPALILAGSSSAATLEQVARARARYPAFRLDPAATPDSADLQSEAVDWIGRHLEQGTVLVYASAPPSDRGPATTGAARAIELAMAELARAAVRRGVRRIVVAGGETSGAVVDGLGIDRVVVAREEDLGVPWLVTAGPAPLALLLKSGNFGHPDLLVRAAEAP